MKKVQQTVGSWVQRIVGKSRAKVPVPSTRQPVELDTQDLRQVSGGTTDSPNKGW